MRELCCRAWTGEARRYECCGGRRAYTEKGICAMKKGLWIYAVLILAGVSIFPLVCGAVNSEKEKIEVTETVLFGDAQAAEGILLEIGTHWDERLMWTTMYQPGRAEEAASSFTFSPEAAVWRKKSTAYAEINIYSGYGTANGYDGNTGREQELEIEIDSELYALVLQGVADRTAPGEEHTEIVALSDYYEYYPLSFHAVSEERKVFFANSWSDYLAEYFGLRVPEDDLREVTIKKNAAGAVTGFQYNVYSGGYYLTNISAFGGSGCFYTFYRESMDEHAELYEGETYYIYYLPYMENEKSYSDELTVDLERIERVYRLPEGVLPVELVLDKEEGLLYLTAKDQMQYYLFVYEAAGGLLMERQRLPVLAAELSREGEAAFPYYRQMTVQEDGILITWEGNRFVFLAEEDGNYRVWCTDIFPGALESGRVNSAYGLLEEESAFPLENSFAFDGRRLALAAFDRWGDLSTRLLVYTEGRLAYSGLFEYSGELDRTLGLPESESIQAQGAANGRLRKNGAEQNPLKVTMSNREK